MGSIVRYLTVHFAAGNPCSDINFLGLVPWYHYLNVQPGVNGVCQVVNFNPLGGNSSILLILLAIVDDLLRIVGLLAVIYVLYAGIRYVMSQGSPEETAKAQTTIINALLGLALAIVAIWLVSFLGHQAGSGNGAGKLGGLDLSSLPYPGNVANGGIIQVFLNVIFAVTGALSFVFLIIGGFRYALSQGEPQGVERAKNTILYALIGLVVAILAQSIVSLITSKL